jgi:hypothetical protein
MSRKTLNHVLGKLSRAGIVSIRYGRVIVRDLAALERIAMVNIGR